MCCSVETLLFRVEASGMVTSTQGKQNKQCSNDNGDKLEQLWEFSSLSSRNLLNSWGAKWEDPTYNLGDYSLEQWYGVRKHIERIRVKSVTPSALFQHLPLDPKQVVVFVIDAEGYDLQLVPLFLLTPGFRPAYLQFEAFGGPNATSRLKSLVHMLFNLGYRVDSVNHDVVALDMLVR
eukprot:TRINITY_DN29708_c0_g1_i2.p1 TRINITY_DN29708_c0_g1~~TRINITY_DN29708_c0_g1_i2.p1  ORF type:complete len:178 (-),score=16.38 TRINITY_DN29708_c0_g1_i2:528-1061(-)